MGATESAGRDSRAVSDEERDTESLFIGGESVTSGVATWSHVLGSGKPMMRLMGKNGDRTGGRTRYG
jgi:hypothetical protein